MSRFLLTWDTISTATVDPEALRVDIFIAILEDNGKHKLYQPNQSVVVFESETDFKTWKQRFAKMADVMYYTISEVFEDLYSEKKSNIDVSVPLHSANSRIAANNENKSEHTVRRIVNEILRDELKNKEDNGER